jgi:hypothetical protein
VRPETPVSVTALTTGKLYGHLVILQVTLRLSNYTFDIRLSHIPVLCMNVVTDWNAGRQMERLSIYIETSVSNKCRCSFYCALFTLHVSAPIGGHLQVVCNKKNSKVVTV